MQQKKKNVLQLQKIVNFQKTPQNTRSNNEHEIITTLYLTDFECKIHQHQFTDFAPNLLKALVAFFLSQNGHT